MRQFISLKFKNANIDAIKIGRPHQLRVPACAYHHPENDLLVLPIPLGGMDKYQDGLQLVQELSNAFSPEVLLVGGAGIERFGILFVFDADSRGRQETLELFQEQKRYGSWFGSLPDLQHATWSSPKDFPLAVFVFTGEDGSTGTLEDNLITLFRRGNANLIVDAEHIVKDHFQDRDQKDDETAYESKKKKGILTICGQQEKKNAGSALTVVIRDSTLLNGAFDFSDKETQWGQLLVLINSTFFLPLTQVVS